METFDEEVSYPALEGDEADNIIESVLFAAGHPVEYAKMAALFGCAAIEMKDRIAEFSERYNRRNTGLRLLALDGCAQICTREEYAPYIREALAIRKGGNLSNSSMEVLSIVAYRQPVTRVYIDRVRGVDSSYAVNSLLERGLIKIVGRLDQPGRPMLFGTTPDFLRSFGIDSITELPKIDGVDDTAVALINLTMDDVLAEGDGSAPADAETEDRK